VLCYSNCEEVLLTLNDRPIGSKPASEARDGVLVWQFPFEAGILKAKGLKNGRTVCEYVLQTAGPARRVVLSPDVTEIRADGKDVCLLSFEIQDKQGVRVPDAQTELHFSVSGPAHLIGIENGNLNSIESPKDLIHKAYLGRGLAFLQSRRTPGPITVEVNADGLTSAKAALNSRQP
jgi:beta-galactosidase